MISVVGQAKSVSVLRFLMRHSTPLTILILLIALLASMASATGIFTNEGPGPYIHESIRNQKVAIYGKGLYQHMSTEVAPQGIAQDYITLFVAVPLMLIALVLSFRGSIKARLVLTGIIGYLLVTYLFYLVMAMYNTMFLGYVALLGLSFYSFLILIFSFDTNELSQRLADAPNGAAGIFLIVIPIAIAFLWLSIVVPPLLDGSIIPIQVEHYTTLIVQGLDLAILLPAAAISGSLFYRKKKLGYLLAPVYLVFLGLLMTALSAKVIAMSILGYNVVPVIFIIPTFNVLTLYFAVAVMRVIKM